MERVVGALLQIVVFASTVKIILDMEDLVRKSSAVYKGSVLNYRTQEDLRPHPQTRLRI